MFGFFKIKSVAFAASFPLIMMAASCHCDHELEPRPPFKVGHVLCTDGSVQSLCDYVKSSKEAVGIVFYVNEDPESDVTGYAVYIKETKPQAFADACGVEQGSSMSLTNLDGNSNTYALYTCEDVASPMAKSVFDLWTYGQSAFVPSVAELRLLKSKLDFVNKRILAVGGDPIPDTDGACWFWSSTEVDGQQQNKAWLFSMNYGSIQETPKDQPHSVRPVIEIRK